MGAAQGNRPSLGRLNIARASGSIGEGKYRVFANLGRGGMADVLLGVAPGPRGFNKLLVIKRLRPNLAADAAMVSMFLDEARLAARLAHPNLVHTFEIGEEADGYFIVMEYLEGRPISQIIEALKDTGAHFAPEIWAKIASEVLAGLHYAHELCDYDGTPLNVVHRDVSPQNVIVTFDGGVKLLDFGIAKANVNLTETETGILKGKLAYMAPEQARIGAAVDRRADIFSMGIVLWECLAQQRLITGDAISAAKKLQDMTFPPPSSENPDVPPELDAITLRALQRDPAARFQTAEEMRSALEGYLRTSGHYVQEGAIGGPIAKLFAEQREDVRAQIRMHMANLRSEREVIAAGGAGAAGGLGATPTPQPLRKGDVDWPKEVARLPRIDITESTRSVRAVQKSTPAAEKAQRAKLAWGLSVGLVVALGVLLATTWVRPAVGRRGEPEMGAASGASVATAPEVPARPVDTTVRVELHASPSEASITLDDAPVTNPFAGSFARDALAHRVQVTREGYAPEGRLLRFDGADVNVGITLAPLPDAGAAEARPRIGGVQMGQAVPGAPREPAPRPHLDKDPYK